MPIKTPHLKPASSASHDRRQGDRRSAPRDDSEERREADADRRAAAARRWIDACFGD